MPEQKPSNDAATVVIKKITLPDGFRVGIKNLDNILKEVEALKLTDDQVTKKELLERVKTQNYVARGAESEYSLALFQEYQRRFGESKEVRDLYPTEVHKHTAG